MRRSPPTVTRTVAIRDRGGGCDLVGLTSGCTRSLRPIPCVCVCDQLGRPADRAAQRSASDEFVFIPDDQAVVVQESGGTLARIVLGDGARQPLPITTEGRFDALCQTLPPRSTCRTVRRSSFASAQSDQPAT
jgi:hypothetical protein